MREKFNLAGIGQKVFGKVLIVCLVSIEDRSFGEVKLETAKVPSVIVAAGREGDFDWNALSGRDRMDLQAIEKAALAAVVSPIRVACSCFRVNSAPVDSDVVADLNRATVDQVHRLGITGLVDLAEPLEKRFQKLGHPVKPPVESTWTEPASEVFLLFQQLRSHQKVAAEEASGYNRGRHHFRVGNRPLLAFLMAAGLEPIIDEAVNGSDSGVHRTGRLRE